MIQQLIDSLAPGGGFSRRRFPCTSHAAHADHRPCHRKEQAGDGCKRALARFGRHLA